MRRIAEFQAIGCLCLLALTACSKKSTAPGPGQESKNEISDDQAKSQGSAAIIAPRARFNPGFPADPKTKVLGDKPGIFTIFISADGKRVAVSNSSFNKKKIQIWDISGEPRKLKEYDGTIRALSPDGKRMHRSIGLTQEVVDADTGKVLGFGGSTDHSYFRSPDVIVNIQPSGDWSKAKKLKIDQYNAADGKLLDSFDASEDDRVRVAAPVNQGRETVLGLEKVNRIQVWDLVNKTLIRETSLKSPKAGSSWWGYTVSSDGKFIAMALGTGEQPVDIFDSTSGNVVATLPRGIGWANGFFVPNRAVYISSSRIERKTYTGDGLDLAAYDVKQQQIVAVFRGHEVAHSARAVSANGKVMASGDQAGNVLIWDLAQVK